ncbi:hypothetical protein BDN71DRAFT_756895 [Pleurotus eryngii]|uniref:Uncharacterized protein n=1 Tax=Pleurotus eryngii TaxID=5323 RepID=A0A9P5ZYP8_PLEER|nr:hypothetical protein BDN71DRAFT_756895 [Pleurotus eryngii]
MTILVEVDELQIQRRSKVEIQERIRLHNRANLHRRPSFEATIPILHICGAILCMFLYLLALPVLLQLVSRTLPKLQVSRISSACLVRRPLSCLPSRRGRKICRSCRL